MFRVRFFLRIAILFAMVPVAIAAHAERRTVCTITVNSDDEREVLRRTLPASEFDFVELVERGRPDWLRGACERNVRCASIELAPLAVRLRTTSPDAVRKGAASSVLHPMR